MKLDLALGGEQLHRAAPDNLIFDWGSDEAATEAALAALPIGSRWRCRTTGCLRFPWSLGAVLRSWKRGGCTSLFRASVWDQGRAERPGLGDLRVTTLDVGGGFGMKAMNYPENMMVAFATQVGPPGALDV